VTAARSKRVNNDEKREESPQAIVIISDGADNHSHYAAAGIESLVCEADGH
jgi:hypothetical protein